jgi:hypothetical protein
MGCSPPSPAASVGRADPDDAMALQSLCAVAILFVTNFQTCTNTPRWDCLCSPCCSSAPCTVSGGAGRSWKGVPGPRVPRRPGVFLIVTLFMAVFAFKQWPKPSLYSLGSICGHPGLLLWSAARGLPTGHSPPAKRPGIAIPKKSAVFFLCGEAIFRQTCNRSFGPPSVPVNKRAAEIWVYEGAQDSLEGCVLPAKTWRVPPRGFEQGPHLPSYGRITYVKQTIGALQQTPCVV